MSFIFESRKKCRNRNRDGKANRKKENGFKKDLGVATIVILEKLWKTMKIK